LHEYSTPLAVDLPMTGNLTDDVLRNAAEHPEAAVFSRRTPDGWADVTAAEFLSLVRAVAKGLVAEGVEPGDRVALMSRTRYEWTVLDYAIWFAGAVTVPVYDTSSAEQLGWILSDSGAHAVVVEDRTLAERADAALSGMRCWSIEDGAVDELVAAGAAVGDADVERRRAGVSPDDLATLIYTSGTTGRTQGCMLTHGSFMAEVTAAVDALPELFGAEDASTLLFLPLAHVFARVIQVGAVRARVRLGYTAGVTHLVEELRSFRPTFVLAVPRVYEKIVNTASQQAAVSGRGRAYDRAADTAIAYSRALDAGRPGIALRARHRAFDRKVYAQFRSMLGGECRYVLSGGAPLGERLGHFLRGIGVSVLEGYGLTETTAAVTVNLPGTTKIGTVGRPLPGVSVRVAGDGELLVRGDQVFAGYWHDEQATSEVLDAAGWLHTGDLGEIDDEGFVTVIGRKQEVIVTAGGKNVAPAPLENRLRAHPLVSQCMLVGEGRPYVAALVTLDAAAATQWAAHHGKPGSVPDLVDDPDLHAEIETAVTEANSSVSQAEGIRRFRLLPYDWTEEGGHLTPSLKLKRATVMREFRSDIDRLYDR
jgi:long-chain acyl-CoA synthetase